MMEKLGPTYLVIIICCFNGLFSLPTTKPLEAESSSNKTDYKTNETISQLVDQQTDLIKKIVNNQQESIENRETPSSIKINQTIWLEDLRTKCKHLESLLKANKSVENKPQVRVAIKKPIGGFYITTERTPISKKPIITPPNIKMVKLEPVILQKTILSDGRTIYYWHKSLPGALHYPYLPQLAAPTTTTTTTTTTTESPGYDFRDFFPSVYSFRRTEESPPTSTTTSTTEKSPSNLDDFVYEQQLRFVLPVPNLADGNSGENERSAQFPKIDAVNVKIPYLRDFHIIKTLTIPNNS